MTYKVGPSPRRLLSLVFPMFLGSASVAHAEATVPAQFNGADTAWLLLSAVLVLMMTIPGLALFYGGMP